MTNYERIKSMSIEEIATAIYKGISSDPCDYCEYNNGFDECRKQVAKDALDLINRLQAEIERLKKTEIEIDDFCRRLCRMRMLNGSAIASYQDLQNYIQEEKSKAVKEFAERLCGGRLSNDPVVIAVKCELKEMEGED